MEGGRAGLRRKLLNHAGLNAAADQDIDVAVSCFNQFLKQLSAFNGGVFLTGGQDGVDAQFLCLLQSLHGVGTDIESPVQGYAQCPCFFHQNLHALNIQAAVRFEDADDDAVRSGFPKHFDVAADDFELLVGIAEIAEAGTD